MRFIEPQDIALFAAWEKRERPYPWTQAHFKETMSAPTSSTWVWEKNGAPFGFATIQVIQDEAYLLNIMVDPEQRQQGRATKMLSDIFVWVKQKAATRLILDVDTKNTAAIRLYKKTGFQVTGERPNAYPRGESAYTMRREV